MCHKYLWLNAHMRMLRRCLLRLPPRKQPLEPWKRSLESRKRSLGTRKRLLPEFRPCFCRGSGRWKRGSRRFPSSSRGREAGSGRLRLGSGCFRGSSRVSAVEAVAGKPEACASGVPASGAGAHPMLPVLQPRLESWEQAPPDRALRQEGVRCGPDGWRRSVVWRGGVPPPTGMPPRP